MMTVAGSGAGAVLSAMLWAGWGFFGDPPFLDSFFLGSNLLRGSQIPPPTGQFQHQNRRVGWLLLGSPTN